MAYRSLLIFSLIAFCLQNSLNAQSNYTLINDAIPYSGCNCFQLTANVDNQGGGVYQNNTISLNNSFDFTFNVFLGCNTANGADGMVFVLTNNISGIGAQGGGLGYSGLPGNSLAIEYDTYQNGWDPSYNHIAIEYGGQVQHPVGTIAGPVAALPSAANIDDCAWHTTRITWNVSTQTYSVYFDGNLRLSITANIVSQYFGGNPIVNWGWSGSTGGDNNYQRFCVQSTSNWVAGTDYETCNLTVPFHDISTSNLGSVQSWAWNFGEPASGTRDTSSQQNPTHTYAGPGTYNVTLIITDITGCADTFSHPVVIAPNIALTDTLNQPPCNGGSNGSIDLGATGGFGPGAGFGGYHYAWSTGYVGPQAIGLTAGTYNVTVTDGVCTTTASYTLNQPPPLTATTSSTDANCGSNNGSVTLSISGGTPPYNSVTWSGVPGYTRTGLGAGTYVANFFDANGCSALLTYRATVGTLPCGYTTSTASTNASCYGSSNGSVTLTVTGTVGTATINWYNSGGTLVGTGATVTGLPAGTYSYHYQDGLPTVFTGTVTVNQPGGAMAASLTTVNTTCSYLNNGSAVASVTANGSPPYNYTWSAAGQPNAPTASGLSPGTISVTVTDANGCTATASGTVNGQPALSAAVSTLPDSCYGTSTGRAMVAVSGGTPVYSYVWNNGGIGDTNFNILPGLYTVTVTDHNSCTITASGTVSQPSVLSATMTPVNVTCFGTHSGSATVNPTGGNGGYAYSWSSSATTATASNLADSTYYVTVTDSKLCKLVDSVTLTQPTRLSPTYVIDSVSCHGGSDGSITVSTTGGTPSYTYAMDGSGVYQSSGTFSGLSGGAHTVTVKDANSCDSVVSFSIYQPPVLSASIVYTRNATCNGSCNGSVAVTASGGVAPYQYSKDGVTFFAADSFNSLCSGPYTITVKDAHGCTTTLSATITQPSAVTLTVNSITQPSCNRNNGQIVITASGGTAPYQYDANFGTPQLTGTFTGLSAGMQIVGAGDANLCIDTLHILLTGIPAVVADTLSTTGVSCFGGTNGAIVLSVSGGTQPYTYVWPGYPGITDSIATGLPAGTYSAYVTDATGCRDTVTTSVSQPSRLSPAYVADSVSCHGGSDASVTVTTTGGTAPYTYALDGSGVFQSSGTFSGLSSGAHTVTVKDANSCDSVVSFSIYQPPVLSASIVYTRNATCNGSCNGSVAVTASGGVAPYQYSKDGITFFAADSFNSLCSGPYTITVKDAHGCTTTLSATITQPSAVTLTVNSITEPSCHPNSGQIVITASGGTAPYQYDANFGTPQLTGTFTGLSAGLQIVGAADANLCIDTLHILLTGVPALLADTLSTTEVGCFGGQNGAIVLSVSGGTYPYSYIWPGHPGITDSIASGLAAGSYTSYITDANGCSDTITATISQPAALLPAIVSLSSASCFGSADGGSVITASGGVGPYQFELDASGTFQASGVFGGLMAGPHTVTVQDAHLCDSTVSFIINQPALVEISVTTTVNDSCNGSCNGVIVVQGSGGTTPYQFSIDGVNFSPSDTFYRLCANPSYTLYVRDVNGCQNNNTDSINQPTAVLIVPVDSVAPACPGASTGSFTVSGSGGHPGYIFNADGGAYQASGSFSGLPSGLHVVTAKDSYGCTGTYSITIPAAPAASVFDTTTRPVSCFGGNNGAIFTNIVSGSANPYHYAWSGSGSTADSLSGLAAGNYSVTVTDSAGCAVIGPVSITVSQPTQITFVNAITPVTCFGDSNGCITVTPSGGIPGYTQMWAGGITNPCLLPAGSYTDSIKDANGCLVLDAGIIVSQPTQSRVLIDSVTPVSCAGQTNGAVAVSDTGGTPAYTYVWSTGSNSNPLTGLSSGTYTVTGTDSKGCTATASATISIVNPMVLNAQKADVLCPPKQNGSIVLPVTGGTPGYQFRWSNGSTLSALYNLAVDSYQVTVTDARGCTIDTSFVIRNDSAFSITANPDTVTINEGDNTNIGISLYSNGAGGFDSILWSPSTGLSCSDCQNPLASPIATTQYTVVAVSDSGCVSVSQVLITVNPQHQLYIPNAFSPNGDGINDNWEAYGYKSAWILCQVSVYDRWGEKVFESNDINYQWDGKFRGDYVQPGEYPYVFKVVFVDGYTVDNKGTITVLR